MTTFTWEGGKLGEDKAKVSKGTGETSRGN